MSLVISCLVVTIRISIKEVAATTVSWFSCVCVCVCGGGGGGGVVIFLKSSF